MIIIGRISQRAKFSSTEEKKKTEQQCTRHRIHLFCNVFFFLLLSLIQRKTNDLITVNIIGDNMALVMIEVALSPLVPCCLLRGNAFINKSLQADWLASLVVCSFCFGIIIA